ncbi:periplasmic protein, FlgD ig superfamily [Tamlana sedimentorum]|uniref:Periplasmic protein, FlgD ig superfamily n=3 Tax=Neotamlana TaxID=3400367 RepID=A0A0D7WDZ6_9FLAO|nr:MULTISPECIES: DUF2271 domain-containing protein [Tamlana]KJD36923.1 periplasmic protein, FlgD ig superfamily [Tamlana sedimentorum]MCB4799752.1 DUF2271 domain-containing protein [Tamlana laminarinivorans]MCB4807561.1 DUF2271 domain-containing protein [Tamlana sargassicola]
MKLKYITLLSVILLSLVAFTTSESTKYKCMIQMTNYTGHGAYVVISLINPEGEYDETLYVKGDDDEWFNTVEEWWKFYGKKRNNIDAITGETIAGGERAIEVINIEDSKIDAGYSIRFETAVEDDEYIVEDVQFELTSANIKAKHEGKGFIRYIRMMPN